MKGPNFDADMTTMMMMIMKKPVKADPRTIGMGRRRKRMLRKRRRRRSRRTRRTDRV